MEEWECGDCDVRCGDYFCRKENCDVCYCVVCVWLECVGSEDMIVEGSGRKFWGGGVTCFLGVGVGFAGLEWFCVPLFVIVLD